MHNDRRLTGSMPPGSPGHGAALHQETLRVQEMGAYYAAAWGLKREMKEEDCKI